MVDDILGKNKTEKLKKKIKLKKKSLNKVVDKSIVLVTKND